MVKEKAVFCSVGSKRLKLSGGSNGTCEATVMYFEFWDKSRHIS